MQTLKTYVVVEVGNTIDSFENSYTYDNETLPVEISNETIYFDVCCVERDLVAIHKDDLKKLLKLSELLEE